MGKKRGKKKKGNQEECQTIAECFSEDLTSLISLENFEDLVSKLREKIFTSHSTKNPEALQAEISNCRQVLDDKTSSIADDTNEDPDNLIAIYEKHLAIPKENSSQLFGLIVRYDSSKITEEVHEHDLCETDGACRAHLFPIFALRSIENKRTKSNKIKGHDQDPLRNEIPCIILPKSWEIEIDAKIASYAQNASDTGAISENRPKDKRTAAISEPSAFAAQHPGVYLQIFEFLLNELSGTLIEEHQKRIEESFTAAKEIIVQLSVSKFGNSDNSLFGIALGERSRTISEGEGRDNYRTVPEEIGAPSFEGFRTFYKSSQEAPGTAVGGAAACQGLNAAQQQCL